MVEGSELRIHILDLIVHIWGNGYLAPDCAVDLSRLIIKMKDNAEQDRDIEVEDFLAGADSALDHKGHQTTTPSRWQVGPRPHVK